MGGFPQGLPPLLLAAALLMGCDKKDGGAAAQAGKPAVPDSTHGKSMAQSQSPWKVPEAYAETFRDYRKSWAPLTGYEFSGLHWNQFIALYVNKDPSRYMKNYLEYIRLYVDQDGEEAEEGDKHFEPYGVGTIFLKENFLSQDGKPGAPMTITAMIKREPGFDPGSNDWQFLQWNREGVMIVDGNSHDAPTQALCIKCHSNMAERDFVFSTYCNIKAPAD